MFRDFEKHITKNLIWRIVISVIIIEPSSFQRQVDSDAFKRAGTDYGRHGL